MVPDPTVPVVSWLGRVSSVRLRRSSQLRLAGSASVLAATGSIRVRDGSGPALAGTRSTGTVSAGALRATGTRSAGTVVSGTSPTSSTGIPDATEAIRPSAAAATNTMTT